MSLEKKIKIIQRSKIIDNRGWFYKVIDGLEENIPNKTGEVYLTCAKPNQSKGGHYHLVANEWFTLISGKCILKLYDIETKEYLEMELSENKFYSIFVPSKVAHIFDNITNKDFLLLAYSDQLYDSADTIMYDFT